MTWRPWIITALLLGMFLVNLVLVFQERLPDPTVTEQIMAINEPLRHLSYKASTRRNDFKEMGMDDDLAHAVATRIDRYVGMKAKFQQMLADQAADVGDVFCPTPGLPQPYAASRYLILEENDRRDVADAGRLIRFDEQPWYAKSPVQQIYNVLEHTENRRAEATVMGVSALLLGREADVLDGTGAWSRGVLGTFGFRRLERQSPSIRVMVIDYFSLVHYLTELANTPDGICS